MSKPRTFHSATVLDDGRVLIVGGACGGGDCGQQVDDLYDPKTDTIAPLTHPGGYPATHVAAKLLDGRLLITANDEGAQHLVVAYDAKASPPGWETLPNMPHPRFAAEGVRLQDGSVLVVGGIALQTPLACADQVERLYP